MVGTAALDVSVDVCLGGHSSRGLHQGDGSAVGTSPSLDGSEHVVDAFDDGGLIRTGGAVGLSADGHAEVVRDRDAAAAGHSGAQVLGDSDEGVARLAEGAFGSRSPLELASDSVGTDDLVVENEGNTGGGGGEDSSAVVEVGVLIGLDGGVVGGVKVVSLDAGVGDDEIGIGVVEDVITNWGEDPLGRGDHRGTVGGRALDDVEHVLWADSRAEQDLGGSERASGEDDPSGGPDLVDAGLAVGSCGKNLHTGGGGAATYNTADHSVGHQLEVCPLLRRPEVGGQGTATLAVGEHERRVTISLVLLVGGGVDACELSPSGLLDGCSKDRVGLQDIALSVHRGGVGAGDTGKHAPLSGRHVRCLPSGWEVVVPVAILGNKEHASVNCSTATEDTSCHAADIFATDALAVNPDFVAKTRDIEASEVLCFGPFRGDL